MFAKRRRRALPVQLLDLPSGLSLSALERLLRNLDDRCCVNGGEEGSSPANGGKRPAKVGSIRKQMHEALLEEYSPMMCKITLQTSGGPFEWTVAKPEALLKKYLQSPVLSEYVVQSLGKFDNTPHSPWRLVLYCDELTPGEALKLNNKRKLQAYYITVLELNSTVRSHREGWLPVGLLRTSVGKTVTGNWTTVARQLLKSWLAGPTSVVTAGVPLTLPGREPRLFWFSFSSIIGDSPALQQFWGTA